MHAPLVLPAPQVRNEEVPLPPQPRRNPFRPVIDIAIAMSAAVSMAYVLPFRCDRHDDTNREQDY